MMEVDFSPVVPSERKRGNRHQLKYRNFCLNMRKNLFCLQRSPPFEILKKPKQNQTPAEHSPEQFSLALL